MKIRLVKFKDGKYGIRQGTYFSGYKFFDLRADSVYWWATTSRHFEKDCRTSKDSATRAFDLLTDKGVCVN